MFSPNEKVKEEATSKHNWWVQSGSLKSENEIEFNKQN
jgi:hypothetical protein